jgi:hypothetical protein
VLPALCTVLPAGGLVPLTAPATVPAVLLTAVPTSEPALATPWETPEVAFLTAPCAPPGAAATVGSAQVAPVHVPFVPRVEPPEPPEDVLDGVPPPVTPVPVLVLVGLRWPRAPVGRTSNAALTAGVASAADRRLASREL